VSALEIFVYCEDRWSDKTLGEGRRLLELLRELGEPKDGCLEDLAGSRDTDDRIDSLVPDTLDDLESKGRSFDVKRLRALDRDLSTARSVIFCGFGTGSDPTLVLSRYMIIASRVVGTVREFGRVIAAESMYVTCPRSNWIPVR